MRILFALTVILLAPLAGLAGDGPDQQARALFDADWQWRMQNQPEYATMVGDYRYNASLSDTSPAGVKASLIHERRVLEQARAIDRDKLNAQNQLSHDLFVYQKEQQLKAAALVPVNPQPLTGLHGIHIGFVQMAAQMPFATEADYRNYLSRLEALPLHVAGLVEQMREGMRTGWVPPKAALRTVPGMLRQLREGAVSGAMGRPFRQIPATIDKPVREALALAGPAVLRARVMPSLQELEDFVRTEYLPAARDTIAASALPRGQEYYAYLTAHYIGVAMNPADIHALGLKEVARIRALMPATIAQTGFTGSFSQFATFASSDARLFSTSEYALLARYRRIIGRTAEGLPKLFSALPKQELLVKSASILPGSEQGAAWYEAGAGDRPAAFVVNTARLNAHPLWEMETLVLHEALPGHHLQVARAHEFSDLPAFRKHAWNVGFGEGWATYAESLGPELGLFKEAFSAFGYLNAELFRAVRLVVDTGIHTKGWTRQQAIDYMNANSANSRSDNEIEVDRYIAWPGQALGYKLGQLKIKALRDKSQAALGPAFDIRRFHAVILDNGPLPLPVLEQQVDQWLAGAARN